MIMVIYSFSLFLFMYNLLLYGYTKQFSKLNTSNNSNISYDELLYTGSTYTGHKS